MLGLFIGKDKISNKIQVKNPTWGKILKNKFRHVMKDYLKQMEKKHPNVMDEEKWNMDREALKKMASEALDDIKKMKEKL